MSNSGGTQNSYEIKSSFTVADIGGRTLTYESSEDSPHIEPMPAQRIGAKGNLQFRDLSEVKIVVVGHETKKNGKLHDPVVYQVQRIVDVEIPDTDIYLVIDADFRNMDYGGNDKKLDFRKTNQKEFKYRALLKN